MYELVVYPSCLSCGCRELEKYEWEIKRYDRMIEDVRTECCRVEQCKHLMVCKYIEGEAVFKKEQVELSGGE